MTQNVNLPTTYEAPAPASMNYLTDMTAFENAQRVCKMYAASNLIPTQFQNNIPNVLIALEMAHRTGCNPFMVMQNLYVVHGRPGFSATYIIAAINSCGRFSPLRFDMDGEGDERGCVAWVIERGTGDRLESTRVDVKMAKREGWYGKQGSKWQTMPDQMLRYRAAAFFGRIYAPDILMGMQTTEELYDIEANNEMTRRNAPRRIRQAEPAQVVKAEVVESNGGPASVAEINAMLQAEPAPAEAEKEKKEREPERAEENAPPEYHAMMGYIAEINDIDDVEALKRWWQGRDYKQVTEELGGVNSEFHQAVAEYVQNRIAELEGQKR